MKRYGLVIGLKPEKRDEYLRLHANAWPDILRLLAEANVKNYTIFLKDDLLFGYFEYHGTDLTVDFRKMDAEPIVQKWYELCTPCHVPLATRKPDEWWAVMDEIFRMD